MIAPSNFLDAEFAWAASATTRNFSSIAPTGNLLYMAGVMVENAGSAWDSEPTLSGGGMTSWTRHLTVNLADVFYLFAFRSVTASPGSGVLTFTRGGSNDVFSWTGVCVAEVADSIITGTNGADAIIQAVGVTQDNGVAVDTTVNLNSFAAGNGGLAFFSRYTVDVGNDGSTPRSGWTEIEDENSGGDPFEEMAMHWRADSDTAAAATYGNNGYGRTAVAFEIAAAGGASGPLLGGAGVGPGSPLLGGSGKLL